MEQLLPASKDHPIAASTMLNAGGLEYEFVNKYFTHGFNARIVKIEKLCNRSVQKKFLTELRLSCEKYKDKPLTSLVKLLFHGSKNTKPEDIYQGSQGLDMRFSRAGLFGQGIYFADNPNYSHDYAHVKDTPDGRVNQMFLVFVIVGEACEMVQNDNTLRIPPLKKNSTTERYDSVFNAAARHTIIYENSRQYPAYLVSYTL
jgi:hypothetical protein